MGMKMVIELPPEPLDESAGAAGSSSVTDLVLKPGTVWHTFGYPEPEIFGFMYVHPDRLVSVGIFVPSWMNDPSRTAYRYLQHYIQHPALWKYLKNGTLRSWGAKSLEESGRLGEPYLSGNGYARIGEGSGSTNMLTGSGVDERTVVVAVPVQNVRQSVLTVRDALFIAYPLMLGGLAVLAWRVVGWTLRPVEALRAGAEEISASRSGRLPVPEGDDEVHRLALLDVVPLLPARWAQAGLPADNAELARRPWVGTAPHCGLRASLELFFRETGAEPRLAAVADTEGAVRGMVASGLGAGLVREDQARDAQRLGEAVVWNQWKATTWLCWVAAPAERQSLAVRTVRDIVLEVWA